MIPSNTLITIYFTTILFGMSNASYDFFYTQYVKLRALNEKYPADVLEIAKSTTPKIIAKYGHPAETHTVTTEDGYILSVHRIKKEGGRPFLLLHGLEDSSATYVLMGPKIGLVLKMILSSNTLNPIYFITILFGMSNASYDFFYAQYAKRRGVNEKYPADVLEIAKSTTPKIIAKYGYPAETHTVTTKDGYILSVHRIKKEGGRPFLLLHGLEDSSATYVLMGPKIGLGYLLWEKGYDVWLGNVRGNRYSRKHTTLNPNEKDFWQFSWSEIGIYDLPATIDYVLSATNFSRLYYAGHSQGTTIFWVMCSKKPSYNDKIILMQALAPVAFLGHVKTRYATMFGIFTERTLRTIGEDELLPQSTFSKLCYGDDNLQNIIINIFSDLIGPNPKDFNRTMWLASCCHLPAGAATNQVVHFLQLAQSARFCEYDYGFQRNMEKYGTKQPPEYNLTKVQAPVALYYSENDYLTATKDVEYLSTKLGNVVEKYLVPLPEFNHLDFVWSARAPQLLYTRFLEVLQKFPAQRRSVNETLNEN